jgi:hypothetical protein
MMSEELQPYEVCVEKHLSRYTYPERWFRYVGRCYEESYRYARAHSKTVPGLVLVVGRIFASRRYPVGHAWVELPNNDLVFEATNQLFYQRAGYYRVTDAQALERYTPDEIATNWGYGRR